MDWQSISLILAEFDILNLIGVAFIFWIFKVHQDKKFDKIDKKFEKIDERFDKVDERFDKVYERFDKVDERFRKVEEKLNELNTRVAVVESNMTYLMWHHQVPPSREATQSGK